MRIPVTEGEIEVRESGPASAPPIVFVHGALVDGRLWKDVVPILAGNHHCIVPDWPMGSHRIPMNAGADLSPAGMARVVASLLDAMRLDDVTLVGNDTGGAVCQILCASGAPRVARLALTNCDALEVFPPPQFAYLRTLQRVPGLSWLAAKAMLASERRRRVFRAYGGLSAHPIDDALLKSWIEPTAQSQEVRRDLKKLILGMRAADTLAAAEALESWGRPVLLAWGIDDPFFPPALAKRLAAKIPGARVEHVADASTFLPLDQPQRVAALIDDFIAASAARRRDVHDRAIGT